MTFDNDRMKPENLFDSEEDAGEACSFEELERLPNPPAVEQLAPPPRNVSVWVWCERAFLGSMGFLGWGFFMLGSIGVALVCCDVDYSDAIPPCFTQWEELATPGKIISCEESNVSINGQRIYWIVCEYTLPNGAKRETLLRCRGHYSEGDAVQLKRWGNCVRIVDDLPGSWYSNAVILLLPALFPVVGIVFLVCTYRAGKRDINILQNGVAVKACAVGATPTGTSVNGFPQLRVSYLFAGPDGERCISSIKTYDQTHFEAANMKSETVLYVPEKPSRIVVLEDLRKSIYLTPSGDIGLRASKVVWLAFLGALLAAWGVAMWAILFYFSPF
ncbi:MAG: hypothetical protein Q4D38_02675 [Planctomycetia bacterium]|nr:hypothetical protein [Planctomycetia bacterium]